MITIERKVHFGRGRQARKELREGDAKPEPPCRVPRVAKLIALSISFNQLIRDGEVSDQAELARLGHVTRARLTLIMNLFSLVPEIQEAVLFLPETRRGRDEVKEWELRPVAAEADWRKQRKMWRAVSSR